MLSTNSPMHSTQNGTATNYHAELVKDKTFVQGVLSGSQQPWLIVGGIFLTILIWDISTRIYVPSVTYPSKHDLQGIVSTQHSQLDKQTQQTINQLYANFDAPEPEVENVNPENKPKVGMSLDEQQAQNGKLNKLFIDNNQYQLSGVFWDKQYFAVLIKIDVSTNTPEEIKVAQGQAFGGYTIEHIDKLHVTFVNGGRNIKLSMFK